MQKHTAISHLKARSGVFGLSNRGGQKVRLGRVLAQMIRDKSYNPAVIRELADAGTFGALVNELLIRSGDASGIIDVIAGEVADLDLPGDVFDPYTGQPSQNMDIDRAQWFGQAPSVFGRGAAIAVALPPANRIPARYKSVPIAIIGHGAAGIMVKDALTRLGFQSVTVFEGRKVLGIWSQPNVAEGTRNNPRELAYDRRALLKAAPGGGDHVVSFLKELSGSVQALHTTVKEVVPRDLDHSVHIVDEKNQVQTESFAIVINAMGIGKPKPYTDPERMECLTPEIVAVRWQNPKLKVEEIEKKKFVFVGLGNSTAEMLRVLHAHEDKGIDVDYRVLTHYPRDAVYNPMETVARGDRAYRVFRDLSQPDLTGFQGDLEDSRHDYFRALRAGKIMSNVTQWGLQGENMIVTQVNGAKQATRSDIGCTSPYVLTGYEHSAELLRSMGCRYDETLQCSRHDYDGEVQSSERGGRSRLRPGYFGFGAVLDSPHDRNATVIPGMMFRLPDLLFGIIMRAGEWSKRQPA